MNNPFDDFVKMMNLPMEASSKYYDLMEKGQRAMASMAIAQRDMADFQKAWDEFQQLNPLSVAQKRQKTGPDKPD